MERKLIVLIFIALLAGLGGGYVLGYSVYQPQIQKLQEELDNLNDKVETINATLTNTRSSVASLQNELTTLSDEVANLNSSIGGFINEISRVELLGASVGAITCRYYYGVSGLWNVTKLQTEPFEEKLNSTIGGALKDWESYFLMPLLEHKRYERHVQLNVDRELNPTEIEEVRLLIEEYLAHL